jgi:hypothetical protein
MFQDGPPQLAASSAESVDEARELLGSGVGHRCHLSECLYVEVEHVED